jgi:hypothetical protein
MPAEGKIGQSKFGATLRDLSAIGREQRYVRSSAAAPAIGGVSLRQRAPHHSFPTSASLTRAYIPLQNASALRHTLLQVRGLFFASSPIFLLRAFLYTVIHRWRQHKDLLPKP